MNLRNYYSSTKIEFMLNRSHDQNQDNSGLDFPEGAYILAEGPSSVGE